MRNCPICDNETAIGEVSCSICYFPCFPMFFGMYTLFPEKRKTIDDIFDTVTNPPECCAICLDDIGSGVKIRACKHVYHSECIRMWFRTKQSCPVCREECE